MSGLVSALDHASASARALAVALDRGSILTGADVDRASILDCASALDRDLTLAHDLAVIHDPNLARDLALDSARARARSLARRLARDLTHNHTRTLSHDLARDLTLNLARGLAHDLARDLTPKRASGPGDVSGLARDLTLNYTSGLALTRASGLAGGLARDLVSARARALERVHSRAGAVRDRSHDFDSSRGDRTQYEAKRPMPSAATLLATAVRLLPVRERARYAEEFRSELWEIAHADGRRRAQLVYAARQVLSARRLRAELRVPQHHGVAPRRAG